MPERSFTEDLKVLVTAYLPLMESLKPVEKLVLAQTAIYLEMDEAMIQSAADAIINGTGKKDDLG